MSCHGPLHDIYNKNYAKAWNFRKGHILRRMNQHLPQLISPRAEVELGHALIIDLNRKIIFHKLNLTEILYLYKWSLA